MTELLTSAQMRAIERSAIESGAATGIMLMERAGAGVVAAILEEWPHLADDPGLALVLCGPGNNGGDGFVVARLLAARGWRIDLRLVADPSDLPPDARVNHDRWCELGALHDASPRPGRRKDQPKDQGGPQPDLVIDALFGTGLARPVVGMTPLAAELAARLGDRNAQDRPRVVAIDVPSGLCADSGRVLEVPPDARNRTEGNAWPTLVADLTVTFHRPRPGHLLAQGPALCGRLVVADIGLQDLPARPLRLTESTQAFGKGGVGRHKFSYGHALVVSGGAGRAGAARMAARSALRVGAGLVTLASPPDAMAENAARLDAVMLHGLADHLALERLLQDPRITALCLGPGMGMAGREAALVASALAARRPTVLDADALSLIARDPRLFAALHECCILTPHAGEFARLFPDLAQRLAAPATQGPAWSKVDAAIEASGRAGCTVLLKGPDTVIADPSGRSAINAAAYDRAAPWLATAGSGDVLAGLITGLAARGLPVFDAACHGAWLHVEAALSFGPGLIAEDLPEEVPRVFRALGL